MRLEGPRINTIIASIGRVLWKASRYVRTVPAPAVHIGVHDVDGRPRRGRSVRGAFATGGSFFFDGTGPPDVWAGWEGVGAARAAQKNRPDPCDYGREGPGGGGKAVSCRSAPSG